MNKKDCLILKGHKHNRGYIMIADKTKPNGYEYAHRRAFREKFGDIPKGKMVCHKCDNPPCSNPDHLFLGTQKDNMHDCMLKGRSKNGTTKLSVKDVKLIRVMYATQNFLQKELARQFGVTRPNISLIVNLKRWEKI